MNISEQFLHREYSATDRLRDIIDDNTLILSALSRFEIPLGFGDSTIEDVCNNNNVDTDTFLAVANFMSAKNYTKFKININTLICYLKNAHTYFLEFLLPSIRRRLLEALSISENNDIPLLILKFYDDYQEEVFKHMDYENRHVFTYVEHLLEQKPKPNYSINTFLSNHKPIASKLHELKEIIICHYPGDTLRVNLINAVLHDIIVCEKDLMTHCLVEDKIFVPAVLEIEKEIASSNNTIATNKPLNTHDQALNDITDRECEIIACVARGMSNKEIADKLCLSVHTVATHRRNISAKLQIHSTSGLTIFAIIHKLIDLKDVKI